MGRVSAHQERVDGEACCEGKRERAEKLTQYELQLSGKSSDVLCTASAVRNKTDNLKTKAKDMYKRYRRLTATGSPVGDASDDMSYDLEAAYQAWNNKLLALNLREEIVGSF